MPVLSAEYVRTFANQRAFKRVPYMKNIKKGLQMLAAISNWFIRHSNYTILSNASKQLSPDELATVVVCFRAYIRRADSALAIPMFENLHLARKSEKLALFDRLTDDYTTMANIEKRFRSLGMEHPSAKFRFHDPMLMRFAISLAIQLVAAEIWRGCRPLSFSLVADIAMRARPSLESAVRSLAASAQYRKEIGELTGESDDLFADLEKDINLKEPMGALPLWFYQVLMHLSAK